MNFPLLAQVNAARALRWHPRGLRDWSQSDWTVALAGEVGEVCEVALQAFNQTFYGAPTIGMGWRSEMADEIGDAFTYLDLVASATGENLAACYERAPRIGAYSPFGAALMVAAESGKLCDVVKKLNRVRDGLAGNSIDLEALRYQFQHRLGTTARAIEALAEHCAMDLWECIRVKFNKVSERMNFPERL